MASSNAALLRLTDSYTPLFHFIPVCFLFTAVFNVLDMFGLNGTIPETMCDRAGSGALYVMRFCEIPCDCCVDCCLTNDPEGKGENQDL